METRTTIAGDDAYKENTITKIDWFFFRDAEGTQLLHHETTNTQTLQITEAQLNGAYSDLKRTSYLYALANYTGTIPENPTLAQLLALPVSTPFTKTEKDDEGNNAEVLDKANLKFVMDSYNAEKDEYLFKVSPLTIDDTRTIEVPLSRLAVKIGTIFNIAKEVKTKDVFGNEETWTPVLSAKDFDAYFMNALDAGYLNGDPVRRATSTSDANIKDHYFSYGRNLAAVSKVSEDEDYYVWKNDDPFYTYPQTWNGEDNFEPYFKVIFPWMSDVKGSAEFHYKLVLHDPDDEANVFTLNRNCFYQVEATISVLGGTENDYVVVDVKCSVANWADPGWLSGAGLNSARFFNVPIQEFHVYSQEDFDIPVNTNGAAKVYIKHIEFKDYSGKETVTVEKNFDEPETLTTSYTVASSNFDSKYGEHDYTVTFDGSDKYNKKVVFHHELTDLYIVRDVIIYIEKDDDPSRNAEVIIHHHPAIEVVKQAAGDVFVNGYFGMVKDATFGSDSFTTDVNYGSYVQTYNGDRLYSRVGSYTQSWSIAPNWHCHTGFSTAVVNKTTYRPDTRHRVGYNNYYTLFPDYWYSGGGQYYYVSFDQYSEYGLDFNIQSSYGSVLTTTLTLDQTISTDWYTTDITVTAFSSSNNYYTLSDNSKVYYKIADPRRKASEVDSDWSLQNYLSNETGSSASNPGSVFSEWTDADDIMLCSQAVQDRAIIAPHFLISSALNANSGLTWEEAVRRGATYQEAGYPAGRWRLPTEAEIAFIIARQNDGTLPVLYAKNSTYWTGSGRLVETGSDGDTKLTFRDAADDEGKHSCRFVYDLWYWGQEAMSPNVYHADATKN